VVSVVTWLQAGHMTVVGFPAWAEKFSCLWIVKTLYGAHWAPVQ